MESAEQRLFAPGDGAPPPVLAGREQEQAALSRCISDLTGGGSPPYNVVLIGPRGNGKTALLNWFESACRKRRPKLDVTVVTAAEIPNHAALVAELVPTGIARLLPRKIGIATLGSAEWTAGAPKNLSQRLIARCRRRPLAVLVDEAHTLDLEVGNTLLNASQRVRPQAPFLLVLAGTPGLLAHLGKMNASFADRLASGLLGIGRLSETASKEALEKPLRGQGVGIDANALDLVVEHSQRYAYFIQIWGDALWNQHLATGDKQLSTAHAAVAQPAVETRVAEYYQRRYRELEAGQLLQAAAAVAPLFAAGMDASATDQDIDEALATTGLATDGRLVAREALDRLGYIWCPPGQLPPIVWSAGIPSLMQYVLDRGATAGAASD